LGPLGKRTAAANSIGIALTGRTRRANTPTRIELTADQLTPPDADLEEQAEGTKSAHHTALETMGSYLKIEAVEVLPKLYAWWSRAIETIKHGCERLLAALHREPAEITVSMTEPDKLSREHTSTRDDFARFLRHQKLRSVPALASRIRDESLPLEVREHAVRALAGITGRRFHHEPEKLRRADDWLRRHGK